MSDNNDWIKENKQEEIKQAWLDKLVDRAKEPVNPRIQKMWDGVALLLMLSVAFVLIASLIRLGIVILS